MGHQADPAHCYKYLISQTNLQAFEQLLGISGLKTSVGLTEGNKGAC
jgi:hypothetical protein